MIIAIDGGTTNTRLTLIENRRIIARVKRRVGARDSVSGGDRLREAVKDGIRELLYTNKLDETEIQLVALSGMIGSENGLAAIPHVTSPAGLPELRRATIRMSFPDITSLPLFFIPGVKTFANGETDLSAMDIMRGEETEIVGILGLQSPKLPALIIMPGSHFKYVDIDSSGKIAGFRTTLSGELIRAAAENTILQSSLRGVYPASLDPDCLRDGYEYARCHGIGEALFKIRVSVNFIGDRTPEQLYAFLTGVLLKDDIDFFSKSDNPVYIAGSNPHRDALYSLLQDKAADLARLCDHDAEFCSAIGAELICGEM